ncbi:MAG: hypothetical protein CMJ34_01980 [Phycisphaerae bacterium]|nr:hypothetical protein [Phycisphaerae bacterium]
MRYRYQVNLAGVLYLVITLLVGLAATIRPNNILVWVFGLLLALIAISGYVSGAALFRMSARRVDPGHGRVGRPLTVRYAVRSGSRRVPLFDLSVSEIEGGSSSDWSRFSRPDPAWVMHVGPNEVTHAESVLVPNRRGRMRMDRFAASTSFPFGLLGKRVIVSQPLETLVHPRTIPLSTEAIDRLFTGGGDGDRSGRSAGSVGEYAGLREYRSGDSIRSIAWKRSHSATVPIVIQRATPSPRRMQIMLDLRRATGELRLPEGIDGRAREEDAITLAASIAETVILAGGEVGLQVAGSDIPDVRAQSGRRHLDRLLTTLAGIELDAPRSSDQVSIPALRSGVLVVVHVDRVDPSLGHDSAVHLMPASIETLRMDRDDRRGETAPAIDETLDTTGAVA